MSSVRHLLAEYQRHGYSAAGYDYEGYGASAGKPSSAAACRDIEAVYHYLTGEKGISPAEIVVIGFSVGSGPACYLAEKYPVGALVLEAPFASAFQVVLPFGGLPGDRFPECGAGQKHQSAASRDSRQEGPCDPCPQREKSV